MKVGKSFDGDDNEALKWAQHQVYDESLATIVSGVYLAYQNAREVLKDFTTDALLGPLSDLTYDHRALQPSHDHLAAFWRKQSGYAASQLPIKPIGEQVTEWQSWLRDEVREWFFSHPTIITTCRAVLASQLISDEVATVCEVELLHKLTKIYPI